MRPVAPAPSPDRFKAATWNVYYDTPLERVDPILEGLLRARVSILLIQEGQQPGLPRLLRSHGLCAFRHQLGNVVAWDPAVWPVSTGRRVRLARTTFYLDPAARRGHIVTNAPLVRLEDRAGRSLAALSYHLPSAVDRGRPNPDLPLRVRTTRESMVTLRGLASRYPVCLFGGDDNVDEGRGTGWAFMRRRATGLRQVQAPAATHAGGRRIDDFRVKGLVPLGGTVRPGGGDHRIHVRAFRWADAHDVQVDR